MMEVAACYNLGNIQIPAYLSIQVFRVPCVPNSAQYHEEMLEQISLSLLSVKGCCYSMGIISPSATTFQKTAMP